MRPRALACAAAVLLFAACRGTGERAASGTDARALGPEGAPSALGPQLGADVGARFAPSLEALQRAVTAGEDEVARALVAHLDSLGPDERVWQMTRAFERILDGRAAVKQLGLELVCVPEPLETLLPGAEAGSQAWRLVFRAENRGAEAIELSPGPATLSSTRTDLGRRGTEASTQETRSFDRLKKLAIAPHEKAEVELARFFLSPPPGQLAVRLAFELELRSGVLVRDGRELPAMRLNVTPARATRCAATLPEGALSSAELRTAADAASEPEELLALAVRCEVLPGSPELAALERSLLDLPRTKLELWIPALRWLAGTEAPSDVDGLRVWLRARSTAATAAAPRPSLVLPREPRADAPGGN